VEVTKGEATKAKVTTAKAMVRATKVRVMDQGDGKAVEVFKAVLSSQVGGWVMACVIVGAMAWVAYKDRQLLYKEVLDMRTKAIPLIEENNRMVKDVLEILRQKQ
jgi:hypothetical protein